MRKRISIWLVILMIGVLTSMSIYVVADAKSVYVKGYYRKDGTYVKGHYRSSPNSTNIDNWSHCGNINPYTGEIGTKDCNGNAIVTKPVVEPKTPVYTSTPSITEESNQNSITLGLTKDEVIRIIGEPTFSGYRTLYYGSSTVYLDSNGMVSGWSIIGSSHLKVSMGAKKVGSPPFTIGSTKKQVIEAMGTPDTVFSSIFSYGYSSVYFDLNGKVSGWFMYNENPLNATLGEKNPASPGFTRGSTLKEVVEAMGTPDKVMSSYVSYGYSTVYFSQGKVSYYSNIGNLKIKQ